MGGYTVAAVVLTENAAGLDAMLGSYGAEKVYILQHAALGGYRCDVYGAALAKLAERYEPEYIFVGATAIGSELAPTAGS